MTTPDRTEELVRAMLERRAGGPVPVWLLGTTMQQVAGAGQVRGGARGARWRRAALPRGTGGRLAPAAALVLLLGLLGGAALAAGGFLDRRGGPEPTRPAVVIVPTDPAPSTGSPSAAPEAPSRAPAPTPRVVPDTLGPDTMAVVTREGDRLRVRTAPGVGEDSKKLEPLLPAGTRMFVANGPVVADGYDWYEVLVDPEQENLYGWVAAADKDGAAWIGPQAPACPDELDEAKIASMNRLDFLACYGDAEVQVLATRIEPMPGDDSPCLSVGADACTVEPAWMNAPIWLGLDVGDGETTGLTAVAAPDVYSFAASAPENWPVVLTLAADQPEARECRFLDAAGDDLVPPGRAALACRMQFVVLDLAWDEADEGVVGEPAPDTMAVVNADYVEAWSAPAGEPGARLLYALNRDILVYVDAGPLEREDGIWFAMLPEDPQVGPYGWVQLTDFEDPSLLPAPIDCPSLDDWAAFNELSAVRRLACAEDGPVIVNVVIMAQPEPQPTSAFACMARPYAVNRAPCLATPQWLASPTGVDAIGPGSISYPAVDPALMAQSQLPPSPTLMRVTGRYEHPDAAACTVTNPATGKQLLDPAEAAIHCRARFVIQAAEPAG